MDGLHRVQVLQGLLRDEINNVIVTVEQSTRGSCTVNIDLRQFPDLREA
jgi:hypothetical protein